METQDMSKYDIFISYRGSSELSSMFAETLYETIINMGVRNIGVPFYSNVQMLGNFMEDIPNIMKDVKYFIIPFDKDYLDSFLTYGGSINEDSVTRKEIEEALNHGCKYFLPVSLDGTNLDVIHLKAIFKDYKKISCSKHAFYIDENLDTDEAIKELVLRVCESIKNNKNNSITLEKNVFMSFKADIETISGDLFGAKRAYFINIAGTSMFSGINVADDYKKSLLFKSWFSYYIRNAKVDVNIILIDPQCYAAMDAENYKMYPRGLTIEKSQIISSNLEKIMEIKGIYKDSNVRVYLTDVALPYAIQLIEFPDKDKNFIKVDIYSAFLSSDDKRPSFKLLNKDTSTKRMYDFFCENIDNIIANAKEVQLPDYTNNWLYDNYIVHRANLNNKYPAMTKQSYIQCMQYSKPIEVDVTKLKDDEFWIGRDKEIIVGNKVKRVSNCTRTEMELYRKKSKSSEDDFLFLDEFINLIDKKIPILFELKYDVNFTLKKNKKNSKKLAELFFDRIKSYSGEYAIISSNSYILKEIKKLLPSIKCGQITLDMSKYEGVAEDIVKLHNSNGYLTIFKPDFMACQIDDIQKKYMLTLCAREKLPLLGWVADTKKKLHFGKCCTNLIVENVEE